MSSYPSIFNSNLNTFAMYIVNTNDCIDLPRIPLFMFIMLKQI